jgi:heat shock protein HslJ
VMAVVVTVVQALPAPPTVEQLKNATYVGIDNEPITLKDGTYAGMPFRPDSPTRPRVALLQATLVTGDLNGDSTPEAAVLLSKASGGSGVFTYLAVAANNGGKLEIIVTTLIGDREQVHLLSIAGQRIVMDIVGHGAGEPKCCPTQKQRRTWELTGAGLKELPKQVLGTVELADLEGETWTLKSLDGDTPLPAGVTVTLTVNSGRAAGIGGCNSYSGAIITGDYARSLKLGLLSSTRKFCAGADGEVEARYLAALQAAFEFGFSAGDLALTYKDGDGFKTLMYSGK